VVCRAFHRTRLLAGLALYDTRRELTPKTDAAPALDYARRRILWRLWHYEKRDGDVSVDIFPFITYDTHPDGFSKTSFLWRLYRYERHPDGGVDLDVLFLPLKRAAIRSQESGDRSQESEDNKKFSGFLIMAPSILPIS
jgi:hypothetical protein